MRTSLPSIGLTLVFSLLIGCAEPLSTSPKPLPSSRSASLSERLRAICAEKPRSCQRLLHDASHEVRRVALDRPWVEVEAKLRQQGLKEMDARENQHTSDYRYLVTKQGWRAGDQSEHLLFLDFSVDRRSTNKVASAKPGFVLTAQAGLLAQPNCPYSQALDNGAYADGSVLFRGLRLPDAAGAAREYPILKKIELTYDFIRDRHQESVPQGFMLRLTFGDSTADDRRGKSLYLTTASGLDAPQDWQGKQLQAEFKPADTIDDFNRRGSNAWEQY